MKVTFNILILICLLFCILTLNNCKKTEKNLPELITVAASGITTNSVLLGGFITDDGGSDITARGICWGKEPNPQISGPKTDNGKGTGSFTSSLTGLTPNTRYYAIAYATNHVGTAYGNEIQFTTSQAAVATVVTKIVFGGISYYGAIIGGQVTNDGGDPVTEKGICWTTSENPTIDNNKIIYQEYNPDAYAVYWCSMSSLQPKSVYHVRAYAINSAGTSYGDDISITTLTVPEVITIDATEITNSSAKVGGNVTSIGDAYNVEIGICYNTDINPTVDGIRVKSNTTGTGEFVCNLTNLTPGTLYYARVYVLWPVEYGLDGYAVYGNEVTFTTH
jgi:hypothetical protein